ncbi:LOW QUALITY PROTEIN: hypothetical protein HID58_072873 [Brassica napus]|uniref:Uncharacterized protein n=1 Tax=Brassica napus TaxID=3708 RepID=A0ABQ7Z5U3_BRANA|nr:LOW QUALITY PROTEIN: hypothetical protein HID58_072873 [Brassica napus]
MYIGTVPVLDINYKLQPDEVQRNKRPFLTEKLLILSVDSSLRASFSGKKDYGLKFMSSVPVLDINYKLWPDEKDYGLKFMSSVPVLDINYKLRPDESTQPKAQQHNQKARGPKAKRQQTDPLTGPPSIKSPRDVGRVTRQGSWLLDTWEHLCYQNDTRRTRLDLTVPAGITSPQLHFVGAQNPQSLLRNHLCSSNSVYPSESFIALRDLIRQGQSSNTRETNKTNSIHNRNPNSKNRNEIPKADDAKLLNYHLPETKAGGDRAVEVSISQNQNPHYKRLHHAITSKQPRFHSKKRDATGGGWPELRQGGRRRRQGGDKGQIIYAEGQWAPATARTLTRRPYAEPNTEIYFPSLFSLLSSLLLEFNVSWKAKFYFI